MAEVKSKSFYDATRTYDDNFKNGPFPVFDDELRPADTGDPKYTFLGKPLYSPFGIAAGPLLNSRFIKYALERGFDAPVYKTQRTIRFAVNQFPNILYVQTDGDLTMDKADKGLIGLTETSESPSQFSITNSFGNPSKGPNFWIDDMKKAVSHQGKGQLMIGSAVGSIKEGFSPEDYYDDFAEASAMADSTGAEVIEINLSCPNVANEGILCYTKPAVVAICQKVKAKIGNKPLIIKLGYFTSAQQELLEQILKETADYVAAIAVINTIPASIVDDNGEQALPGPNRLKSGVCGAGIKWAGLDMTNRLNEFRRKTGLKYEIIGIGGVMTPADFQEYIDAGANLVQSCTGAMWNPKLAWEIRDYLKSN